MLACHQLLSSPRKNIITRAQKNNADHHSIFQLNKTSPFISIKDVKEAFEMTQYMTSYERLRYFRNMGIHYKRSVQYMKMIEEFDETLRISKSLQQPVSNDFEEDLSYVTIDIFDVDEDERFPNEQANELANMIANVAQEKDEMRHVHKNDEKTKEFFRAFLSIFTIFAAMMTFKYLLEQH